MRFLKRLFVKFLIKYIAEYAKKGIKMTTNGKVKKGFLTSEFILAIAGAMLPILNQYFSWNIPVTEVIAILTMILGYIFNRMRLKEKDKA